MDKIQNTHLKDIQVRENSGRDTIACYDAQFIATGFACLAILEDEKIKTVYCDFHDDFVLEKQGNGFASFEFNQVKTKKKQNYQWSLNDLAGFTPKATSVDKEKFQNSFIGKLFVHSANFGIACSQVVFLTNVYVKDEVNNLIKDLQNDKLKLKSSKTLVAAIKSAFYSEDESESMIHDVAKQLVISDGTGYLNHNYEEFTPKARHAIYKYSEIDLTADETDEILVNLLDLVKRKSMDNIDTSSIDSLKKSAGISLDNLLDLLSISREGYYAFKSNGDEAALKNTSILQKVLQAADTDKHLIEYCARQKINWDAWLRDKRHTISEYDLNHINMEVHEITKKIKSGEIVFKDIRNEIIDIIKRNDELCKKYNVEQELIFGAFIANIVRNNS